MKTDKKIAVVILNWNGREMMRQFLPSVVQFSEELADVIVADNASTDGSLEMLVAEFPTVGTIVLDQNYGFAEGYNRALAQVSHPYLLLLNSDVEVSEGWLRPLLSYMEENKEVAKQLNRLRDILSGLNIPHQTLCWDNNYKGLDDWIVSPQFTKGC